MRASVVVVSSNVDRISDFTILFYVDRRKKKYPVEFSKIISYYFGIKSCLD